MTAVTVAARGPTALRAVAAARALAICLAMSLAVAVRWQIFRTAALDGVAEGLIFGLALLAVARLGGLGASVPSVGALAGGLAAGGVLVAVSVVARWPFPPLVLGHAAPFTPWVAVTILVATAEELVLRGVLWRWMAAGGSDLAALLATSVLFALIHVPIYGWHVVPLDFGVGLWFGGLRVWFGGPAAPAAAHVLADLATWWL
jgi:membrane protease YdiL (CAAX protease family)